ncbi:MAG: helix-hairpin-helix domain-containing protein [Planctomycetota bacterium]
MNRRRGIILLSVLLIVTMSALTGTTLILRVSAERLLIEGALRRDQAEAFALSGVRAAISELAEQREVLLEGGDPGLTEEWRPDEAFGGRGVVRLVPFEDGALLRPESAALDINTATSEALASLPGMTPEFADAIVAARAEALFTSVEEVARLPELASLFDASESQSVDAFGADEAPAPVSYMTTFAFDPELTIGVRSPDVEPGLRRVVLRPPWNAEQQADLDARTGSELAEAIGGDVDSGDLGESMDEFAELLVGQGADAEQWGAILDGVRFSNDPFALGKIDINRAPPEVLACLPGIDATKADALVTARERLDESDLASPAWPLAAEELTIPEFGAIAALITTRTTVWRVRVEAGFRDADEDAEQSLQEPGADEFGIAIEDDERGDALRHRVVYEAVIDVSDARPRIAYLRDVTSLRIVNAQRAAARSAAEDDRRTPRELPAGDEASGTLPDDLRDAASEEPSSLVTRAAPRRTEPRPGAGSSGEPADPAEEASPGVDRRLGRWTNGRSPTEDGS